MNTVKGLEGVGWLASVCGFGFLAWLTVTPLVAVPAAIPQAVKTETGSTVQTFNAESLAGAVVARDVFSLGRHQPEAGYDPVFLPDEGVPYNSVPKPNLRLVGLVQAARPAALIEGFPNHEGVSVLFEGEAVGELTVRLIRNGRVEVVGLDTVWVLTVREPWN